ncbi:hypothetical protein ACFYO5_34575 [Streptomyces sp. NPDC006259]|uniref:hypothetical protein n=1 Tax=Streptomyces sp. NPDC006259 TaxID=3364740 RepID=UPI0036C0035F
MTDHTTRLKNAAPLIASHLGVDWGVLTVTADAEDPGVALIGNPNGQVVALHISTYGTREGRLIAEGRLPDAPDDVNRDEVSTSSITTGCIGMAPGKLGKPQQVAGEIQRRLLPTLRAAHEMWMAKVAEARGKEKRRQAAAALIATVDGITGPTRNHPSARNHPRALLLAWDGKDRLPNHTRRPTSHCVPTIRVTADANADAETVMLEMRNLSAEAARAAIAASISTSSNTSRFPLEIL